MHRDLITLGRPDYTVPLSALRRRAALPLEGLLPGRTLPRGHSYERTHAALDVADSEQR